MTRANQVNWRYTKKQSNPKRKRKKLQTTKKQKEQDETNGTVLLSAILEETTNHSDEESYRESVTDNNTTQNESTTKDNTTKISDDNNCKTVDGSDSEEDSNVDINESAYSDGFKEDSLHLVVSDTEIEEEEEKKYLGDEWEWNCWEKQPVEEEIIGPKEYDHYSGAHGLKANIGTRFYTVLQCLFETTAMNRSFFLRLCSESNKYARMVMKERNTSLFLGHKWSNISVTEMIHFFGILLRVSIEPRKMGGYATYFTEDHNVTLSTGYSTNLRGYSAWAKDVMTLIRFKQLRSAFRPEFQTFDNKDKCYQLRSFLRQFNYMARKIFDLGPNASFDEGGIAMRSRFCPVRQYNKDKPAKFRVDFFILADSKHYFIYHLDVYQGKNKANVDIHPSVRHLPTTQKAVANAILKSKINNDRDGCRYLFMDNRYAAPQLFALMLTNYNIRAVGTCKANRVGFASDALQLPKKSERGEFRRLYDKRLGMVITRWKDSKNLQTVSTVMTHGATEVQRRNGANILNVPCPNDIVLYQQNMGGVDRGDQHRVVGAGFANVSHFKKWYKKAFLGIADFSLLQAFTAWNLSVDQMHANRRGNSNVRRQKVIKWQFYSVLAEELMMFVDNSTADDESTTKQKTFEIRRGHTPAPYSTFGKTEQKKRPLCMICSMDEMARAQVLKLSATKARNRKFSRRSKYIVKCKHLNCNIVAHAAIPEDAKVSSLPCFGGMTCFEIAHHPRCTDLFANIQRRGKYYCRTIPSHEVVQEVKELYQSDLPRRTTRIRSTPGRPPAIIIRDKNLQNDIESLTAVEGLNSPTGTPAPSPMQTTAGKRNKTTRKRKLPPPPQKPLTPSTTIITRSRAKPPTRNNDNGCYTTIRYALV